MHGQSKRRFLWPLLLLPVAASWFVLYKLAVGGNEERVVHRVAQSESGERASFEFTERVAHVGRVAIASAQRLSPLVGRVEDEHRTPIVGAEICALAEDAGCCTAPKCVHSDARGGFQIQLDAPPLTVFASHPEYSPVTESGFDREQQGPLVLTMKAGGAAIAGTVLDAAGGPIPGAQLAVTDLDDRPLAVGFSDEHGAFHMRVAAGAIRIRADADGYSEEVRGVDAPFSGIEIRLAPASVINGRVVTESGQGPVADVLVIARGAGDWPAGARSTRSAEDGTFHLTGLRAGSYSLSAIDAHWQSDERQVRVYVAQASSAEIVVRRAARLSGKIQLGGDTCKEGSVTLKGPSLTMGSTELPAEALEALDQHHWPGNVRELRNAVEAYVALGTVPRTVLLGEIENDDSLRAFIDPSKPYADQKNELLQRFTRAYLERLLRQAGGNQSEAARVSGLERSYLGKLIDKLRLTAHAQRS